MANLNVIPDSTKNPILGGSLSAGIFTFSRVKYVPKTADGTIFDCTGTLSASFKIPVPTVGNPVNTNSLAATVTAADATGLTIDMTEAQALALADGMLTGTSKYTLVALTAADTYVAGTGAISAQVGA